jgi:hypothetical protein
MNKNNFLFVGLFLVFLSVGLWIFGVEKYNYVLIAGISLKVIYLVVGLLNGTLAAGRYLAMLLTGIAMVGAGGYLKNTLPMPVVGSMLMYTGFLLKAVSIVFMVVVGRKRRMRVGGVSRNE